VHLTLLPLAGLTVERKQGGGGSVRGRQAVASREHSLRRASEKSLRPCTLCPGAHHSGVVAHKIPCPRSGLGPVSLLLHYYLFIIMHYFNFFSDSMRELLPGLRLLTLSPYQVVSLPKILTDSEKLAILEHILSNGKTVVPDTICPKTQRRNLPPSFGSFNIGVSSNLSASKAPFII